MSRDYRDKGDYDSAHMQRYRYDSEDEYVPMPPKLSPRVPPRSHPSDDDDKIPRSSQAMSGPPSPPPEIDASVDSGIEIDPHGRDRQELRQRDSRRHGNEQSYSRLEDRDQASRNRERFSYRTEYPLVSYSDDRRPRERREIHHDDKAEVNRHYRKSGVSHGQHMFDLARSPPAGSSKSELIT